LQTWLTAFPDLHIAIEKMIAAEDTVVSWDVWTGTQEGPFPQWGAPATGRRMSRESIIIWRLECGRIVESSVVQDNLTMLRQLGIITDDELATAGTPTVATPVP
jgi:predicted ester cyclase